MCVSESSSVDVFTYSQIKRCVNICINRYLYSRPPLFLYPALCDGTHTWNSFLCQTIVFSDHRPVSKFSKFSKEACHVPELSIKPSQHLGELCLLRSAVPSCTGTASAAFLWHQKHNCFSKSYVEAFPLTDFTVQVLEILLSRGKNKWGFLFQLSKSVLLQHIH